MFYQFSQGAKLRKTTKSDIAVQLLQAGKYIKAVAGAAVIYSIEVYTYRNGYVSLAVAAFF
jgi:hypothetical protein